ncbi:Polysaccharide biosynthesis protein [Photobacterium aquimaris]|uniref:Polysaccharide biosynthesis protein n=1 Tax=Photobacterium aquimaris TaxID=512643 RepID=A0A1Y6KWK1_9GAMM|nr:Polysaccharide biosynthesis protein [Photobacterium aquimaris]
MHSFLKKSSAYLISNIINGLSLLFLLPFLTRFLSTDAYSQVVLFQTLIFGLLSFIHLNIFQASNIKFFEKSLTDDEIKKYNTGCVIILSLSILFFLFILLSNLPILSYLLSLSQSWLICAFIIALSQSVIQFCLWQWQMREQAYQYSIYNSCYVIISSLFTLLLLYLLHDKVHARIYALLSVSVIFFYFQYILLYLKNGFHFLLFPYQS